MYRGLANIKKYLNRKNKENKKCGFGIERKKSFQIIERFYQRLLSRSRERPLSPEE